MDIKSFNEFTKSLTEDDLAYIRENEDNLNIDLSDPNSQKDFVSYISSYGFRMSLRLLQLYHEWISKQL